jgi:hypothetical protein
MLRSRSGSKILLLDCCYAGAFERGMVVKADKKIHTGDYFNQGHGRVVITASDAMQYSFEEDDPPKGKGQRSIFTSAVIEGLRTGKAHIDNDGHISHGELYDYTFERVMSENPLQKPGIWVFGVQDDIIIANNPLAMNPIDIVYSFIAKWGSEGDGDGQFKYPVGVAVDTSGNVYVTDSDNHRIQVFSPSVRTAKKMKRGSLKAE